MQYNDPYTPQNSLLQQQMGWLQNGSQQQLGPARNLGAGPQQPMPELMPGPSRIPSSYSAMPFANMGPGFGSAQGYSLSSQLSQPMGNSMPGFGQQQQGSQQPGSGMPGVGQYTNTINATLPQSAITSATNAVLKPVANPFSGTLANQLSDFTRSGQSAGAVNLQRDAAAAQAKLNLANQTANANSGLNWSDLLARLNEAATGAKNSVMQPLIGNVLAQLLQGAQ